MKPETEVKIKEVIKTSETQLETLRKDIAKADKAGIDVKEQKAAYEDISKRVSQLKTAFL